MLGFFSFTEITDPGAHVAYDAWHRLDHMPEQFSIDGITFGQRWARTPRCRSSESTPSGVLEHFDYMTLYLLRDRTVIPPFMRLAAELRAEDRFFADRRAVLSGPFDVVGRWAATRVRISADVVPYRPSNGLFTVVGAELEGAELVELDGVAGVWQFSDASAGRTITLAWIDGDLWTTARELGRRSAAGSSPEWAGPLEVIDDSTATQFATLTPQ